MKKIKTKNSELWVGGDILMIKISGTVEAGEIEKIARIGTTLTKKFKNVKYNIIDISDVRKVPLGARKAALESFNIRASEKIAFIYSNPVARIIGSFFLRRYKLPIPSKMFSTIEEAKKWFKRGKNEKSR